jgi:hypothetical protein
MRKIIFISVLIISAVVASAQSKIRLNFYSAYVFDDSYDVYSDVNTYYNGKVKGGYQWGGGFEFVPNPMYSLELLYLQKSTNAPTQFKAGAQNPVRSEDFDVDLHYILFSGNTLKKIGSGKTEGFFGLMAGVLISDLKSPSTGLSSSNTNFSWGAKLGANIWTSERVGIKLQAQILSASKATGGDLYFAYWGPVVLSTYTTLWQFGLGGGLTFNLGH